MPRLTTSFVSLRERAASLGVRLTREEAALLSRKAGRHENMQMTRKKFLRFAQKRHEKEVEREAFLAAIEEPSNDTHGKHILPIIGIIGTASYAIGGTQVAGDAGMNVIGCVFVGCVSAMGGGTLNALMFGDVRNQGVPWVRARPPVNLYTALTASLATFLIWPVVTSVLVDKRVSEIREAARDEDWQAAAMYWLSLDPAASKKTVSKREFVAWSKRPDDPSYRGLVRVLAPEVPGTAHPTAEQLFDLLDLDGNGVLDQAELTRLIKKEYDGSSILYALDTAAMGASAITGCAAAISRGLHPVVCSVAGVTMCFGGILRDLMCQRDVRLGTAAYAAATAAGTFVYVGLREWCLRGSGSRITLGMRAVLSAGAVVTVRFVEHRRNEPLLAPMHGRVRRPSQQSPTAPPHARNSVDTAAEGPHTL